MTKNYEKPFFDDVKKENVISSEEDLALSEITDFAKSVWNKNGSLLWSKEKLIVVTDIRIATGIEGEIVVDIRGQKAVMLSEAGIYVWVSSWRLAMDVVGVC